MTIKLDESPVSGILITCTECPYWYAFRFDRVEAYKSGEGHAERVHDVPPKDAQRARREYERRARIANRS